MPQIAAKNVVAHRHAVLMTDGPHPVDLIRWCGNRVVIQASNLSLVRHLNDLVTVVTIGGEPDDIVQNTEPHITWFNSLGRSSG